MTRPRPAAVVALLLVGCSSPGELVSRHEPGTPVGVRPVAEAGTYGLFIAGDGEPLLRYPLAAGDRLGFDRSATTLPSGQLQVDWLYAVAAADRRRLDLRQTYEWRRLSAER